MKIKAGEPIPEALLKKLPTSEQIVFYFAASVTQEEAERLNKLLEVAA